jgi:hypothetical protein
MLELKRQKLLRGLLSVKGMRKSLAEANYLRCTKQQQLLHREWISQAERLRTYRTALPARQAAILHGLAATPVGLQEIHSAHETVLKLQEKLSVLEQERAALTVDYQQACETKENARTKLSGAVHQLEKFQNIKMRSDARNADGMNAQEEAEREDRLHASAAIFDHTRPCRQAPFDTDNQGQP